MELAYRIINHGSIKVLAALAIPAFIAWFFVYSQQQANLEVDKYRQEQKVHPTAANVIINNYGLKEIDDSNHIRWQLTAKTGTMAGNNQDVILEGVKMDYFDPQTHAIKMALTAPYGTANQVTRFVKLKSEKGQKVLAEGAGGKSKFECAYMELTKNNQFMANGGVIINWPGVAKVSANSATGTTDMADGPKNLKLVGNTCAEIAVK